MFTCTPLCKRHLVILPQQRISIAASSISHKSQPKPGKSSNTQREVVGKHAIAMSAAGAVLGPLCDGQHSQHVYVKLYRWVPVLFGLAAVILGLSHPYLDELALQYKQALPIHGVHPSWAVVLLGISTFVAQYAASGICEAPLVGQTFGPVPCLDLLLLSTALLQWYLFDRSPQGFAMGGLTALAGPIIEIILIRQLGLYHYTHADAIGVPSWIPWVYFCGAPAVGNLGRKVRMILLQQHAVL